MKPFLLLIMLSLVSLCNAQSLDWQWGKGFGSQKKEYVAAAKPDGAGNIYVTGYFSDVMNFGPHILQCLGEKDAYLMKLDPGGNVLWVKSIGGQGEDGASGLAVMDNGDVVVSGSFTGDLPIGNNLLTSAGGKDIFVARYQPDGVPIWAKSIGSNSDEYFFENLKSLAVDKDQNIFITAMFDDTTVIDTATFVSRGYQDILLLKLSGDGDILWTKAAGSIYSDYCSGIGTDSLGNVYISGIFDGYNMKFGQTVVQDANSGAVSGSLFYAKYNGDGNLVWAKTVGANGPGGSCSGWGSISAPYMYVLSNGNFYFTVSVISASIFGRSNSQVLCKYNENGNLIKVRYVTESGGVHRDLDICPDGDDIIVTGIERLHWFNSTCDSLGSVATGLPYVAPKLEPYTNSSFIAVGGFMNSSLTLGNKHIYNQGDFDFFVSRLSLVPLAVNETGEFEKATVFPNPATTFVTVQLPGKDNQQIIVQDVEGKIVLPQSTTRSSSSAKLNISALPKGMYFLIITDGKGRWCEKLSIID